MQFFISHLASWLRTRRFSEPTFRPSGATNHWKNTVFRDSRLSYLFAHLHLLSSHSFSSTLLSSNRSLLSASSLLCFSSVHIVGSLTSKLPSTMRQSFMDKAAIWVAGMLAESHLEPKTTNLRGSRRQLDNRTFFAQASDKFRFHALLCPWRCHDLAQEAQAHPHSPAPKPCPPSLLENVSMDPETVEAVEAVEAPTHRWHGHETLSCLQFGMTCRQASQGSQTAASRHGFGAWRHLFQLRHRDTRDTFGLFREVGPRSQTHKVTI